MVVIKINNLLKNKFKDNNPKDTINNIRNILKDLGLIPVEQMWYNSVKGYNSVNLRIPNTNIFTNGKGINCEFALASAYGEFMERLQNQILYMNKVNFSKEVNEYKGFKFAPDEKYLDVDDIESSIINNGDIYIPPHDKESITRDLLNKWKMIDLYTNDDKIISVPFFDRNKNNICYVPLSILDSCYVSNGMCAGNTPQEALIEGICEILERYAKGKVFNGEIVVPDIPHDYVSQFEVPYKMILNLCSNPRYNIIVKDCSLGIGLPVVAAILIDLQEQRYFWSFGSHPVFEIALTRVLTEMLQGKDINYTNDFAEFSGENDNDFKYIYKDVVFQNGFGLYPIKSFSKKFSYEFNEFPNMLEKNNEQLLQYLLELLDENKFNLLIRDVSFLGIPSYQVIIPGVSEMFKIEDGDFNPFLIKRKIEKILNDAENIKEEDVNLIIDYINKYPNMEHDNIMSFIRIPLHDDFPLNNISLNLFLGMACYKFDRNEEAFLYINRHIESIKLKSNLDVLKYYKCIRDYISIKDPDILNQFYGDKLVRNVAYEFKSSKDVFKNFIKINCWNCENCQYQSVCSYKEMEYMHLKVKEKYSENTINQMDSAILTLTKKM